MKKRSLLSLFIFLLSSQVFAYSFTSDFENGFYWQTFPVPLKVIASTEEEASRLHDFLEEAVAEWEDALGYDIWQIDPYVVGGSDGNTVRWAADFAGETGYDSQGTLAITRRRQQGAYLVQTEIILNKELSYVYNNTANTLYKVILHELGHTVGLDHSEMTDAIMAPYISGAVNDLRTDDVNGGDAVYRETVYRQQTGFVSELVRGDGSSDSGLGSCGTVDLNGGSGPSSGGQGPLGFALSLMLGMMAVSLGRKSFKLSQFKN